MTSNESDKSEEMNVVLYLHKIEDFITEKKLSHKHMKTLLHVLFELVRIICGEELLEEGEEDLCAALLVDKTTAAYHELEKFIQENTLDITEEREQMSHSTILKTILVHLENTRSVDEFPLVDYSPKRKMSYVKGGYKAEVRNLMRIIETMITPKLNIFHRDDTDTLFDLVYHFCGVDLTREFPNSRIWTTQPFNLEEFRRQKTVAAYDRLEKFIKEYRLIENIPKKRRLGRAKILRILIFYLKKQQNPTIKLDAQGAQMDANQDHSSEMLQTLNNNLCSPSLLPNCDSTQIALAPFNNSLNFPLGAFPAIPNFLNSFTFAPYQISQSDMFNQTLLTQGQMSFQPELLSLFSNAFPPIPPILTMIPPFNPGLVPPFPNSFVSPTIPLLPNVVVPDSTS